MNMNENSQRKISNTNRSDIHNKFFSKSYYLLTRVLKYRISSLRLFLYNSVFKNVISARDGSVCRSSFCASLTN